MTALEVTSELGDVVVTGLSGDLDLQARRGSVRARGLGSGIVRAEGDIGDVVVEFLTPPREASATTRIGDARIVVPATTTYDSRAQTRIGEDAVGVPTAVGAPRRLRVQTDIGDAVIQPAP